MVAPVRSSESVHLVDLIPEQSQNCMETNLNTIHLDFVLANSSYNGDCYHDSQAMQLRAAACARTYVQSSGTGKNLVQTCKPLTLLVRGTNTFFIRKNTEIVEN